MPSSVPSMPAQNHPVSGIHPVGSRPAHADPNALQPGDTVLGVLLAAPLGTGNVARVWSGLDGEAPVALKVLDPILADEPSRAAFVRGTVGALRLCKPATPPGILPVHRVSADGLVLVTAIAESDLGDLTALSWSPQQLVPFFKQLCQALQAAHQAGIVHGGLKPSNIFISDALEPLVADFGLAHLPSLASASPDAGGHAPYAAPEALTATGDLAPTADVYSLGRVFYFLLLDREPDEPVSDLPALFPLAAVPQGLTRILRKCTLRDPEARYPDIAALLADLDSYERADSVGLPGPVYDPALARRSLADVLDPPISQRTPRLLDDAGPSSSRGGPVSTRSIPQARASSPGRASSPSLDDTPLPISRSSEAGPASLRQAATASASDALWLSRRTELLLAATGAALLVVSGIVLAASRVPSETSLLVVRHGAALAAALLTLALPRFAQRLAPARVAFALLAAVLVHSVDVSQLSQLRLRATLSASDPAARAQAARLLAAEGHRDLLNRDLSDLDLSHAELTVVSFRGTSLARANLTGAALTESFFDGADLTAATLDGAELSSTNADLASGWTTATCDEHTRMPTGWACRGGHPASAPHDDDVGP